LLQKKQPRPDIENADERAQSLILELELHQIELELQNEEIRMTQEKAQQSAERYMEFYDFAPFGYFVLSKEGEIMDLNLSGANLLGSNTPIHTISR
jgi:PAS domain-containing protein